MQKTDTSRTIYSSVSAYRTAMMGAAAIFILLFHEWRPVFADRPVLSHLEHYLKFTGFFGVDMFFFLSGMGLFHSMEKDRNPLRFWRKRFARIFLPHAVMAYIIAYKSGWNFPELLRAFFGISFYTESIYKLLWFTPAIATVYLLYPLYYRLLLRSGKPTLFTGGVLLLWLVLTVSLRNVVRYDMFGFTGRLPMVVLGTYFSWHGTRKPTPYRWWSRLVLLIMLGLGGYLAYLRLYRNALLLIPNSSFFLPNLLLSISVCLLLPDLLELLHVRTRVLDFFGRMSFELYCVQEPIGTLLYPLLRELLPPAVIDVILLSVIIEASFVLYLCNTGVSRLRADIAPAPKSDA